METFIRCGDVAHLQNELIRLGGLNQYIEKVGGNDPYLFEDMVETTFELMRGMITALSEGRDPTGLLMQNFNDFETSSPIIYHMRLLASAWLKGNFAEYEAFIPGNVDGYCDEWIMPVDREIDHLGIVLLYNILLKPANIALEIAYLDLSEGTEVNCHRMPEEANGRDAAAVGPMICLLYRPGHYDLLYRDAFVPPPPPPPPAASTNVQVNRATSLSHRHDIQSSIPLQDFSTVDFNLLSMIPPAYEPPPSMSPLASPPPPASSPLTDTFVPPQSPWLARPYTDNMAPPPPPPHQHQQQAPPQPTPPHPHAPSASPATTHPVRFSKYNFPSLPMDNNDNWCAEQTFTTNTFKNSFYNVAHFNNPCFQPEEYRPEAEDEPAAAGSRIGGRKRSTEHWGAVKKEI